MRQNYVVRGAFVPRRKLSKSLDRDKRIDWNAVGSFVVLVWALVSLWSFFLATGVPVPQ
jgi:hypothetical protein